MSASLYAFFEFVCVYDFIFGFDCVCKNLCLVLMLSGFVLNMLFSMFECVCASLLIYAAAPAAAPLVLVCCCLCRCGLL